MAVTSLADEITNFLAHQTNERKKLHETSLDQTAEEVMRKDDHQILMHYSYVDLLELIKEIQTKYGPLGEEDERKLFDCCAYWVESDRETRLQHFEAVMDQIQIPDSCKKTYGQLKEEVTSQELARRPSPVDSAEDIELKIVLSRDRRLQRKYAVGGIGSPCDPPKYSPPTKSRGLAARMTGWCTNCLRCGRC